jgi:RNA polymerase sigma-70 factor (ECF subfamily)
MCVEYAREELRRSKMPSSSVAKRNKPVVTTAAPGNPGADEELVAAAKSGDEPAFETLFKRYQSRIFALALRYTRVREDAEDVVQQTFQKTFVFLNNFEGKSSFSTWLTRIAINEALMYLRRARAVREVSIDDLNGDEGTGPRFNIADASPDPEATYMQRENAQILSGAMEYLRPGTRIVLELQELCELSARETARRTGLSVSAVKARVFHGRKSLRERLNRYGKPPGTCRHQVSRTRRKADGIPRQQLVCSACD